MAEEEARAQRLSLRGEDGPSCTLIPLHNPQTVQETDQHQGQVYGRSGTGGWEQGMWLSHVDCSHMEKMKQSLTVIRMEWQLPFMPYFQCTPTRCFNGPSPSELPGQGEFLAQVRAGQCQSVLKPQPSHPKLPCSFNAVWTTHDTCCRSRCKRCRIKCNHSWKEYLSQTHEGAVKVTLTYGNCNSKSKQGHCLQSLCTFYGNHCSSFAVTFYMRARIQVSQKQGLYLLQHPMLQHFPLLKNSFISKRIKKDSTERLQVKFNDPPPPR